MPKLPERFTFYSPTRLLFGPGATSDAGALVAGLGFRSVLLVCGKGPTGASSGFATLRNRLEAAGVSHEIFDRVGPDPDAETVAAAAAAILSGKHEAVVAYGGGSPIDCAKSAALAAANGAGILEMIYGTVKPARAALPIVAIPTTAGTGSELSSAAVTTDRASGRKLGYSNDSFFPRLAIVDPENQLSMPQAVTAATGMDALTHCIESYLSLAANPLSNAINLMSASMIARALPKAFADGHNIDARSEMAIASAQAGAAFSQTGLGMVHGFAHPVGALHGLAHGSANAIILPYVLAALARDAAPRMKNLAAAMGVCGADCADKAGAEALVQAIIALKAELGIAPSLGAAGIRPEDAPAILADALGYRSRPRSPRAFSDAELGRLLDAAIAGDPKAAVL